MSDDAAEDVFDVPLNSSQLTKDDLLALLAKQLQKIKQVSKKSSESKEFALKAFALTKEEKAAHKITREEKRILIIEHERVVKELQCLKERVTSADAEAAEAHKAAVSTLKAAQAQITTLQTEKSCWQAERIVLERRAVDALEQTAKASIDDEALRVRLAASWQAERKELEEEVAGLRENAAKIAVDEEALRAKLAKALGLIRPLNEARSKQQKVEADLLLEIDLLKTESSQRAEMIEKLKIELNKSLLSLSQCQKKLLQSKANLKAGTDEQANNVVHRSKELSDETLSNKVTTQNLDSIEQVSVNNTAAMLYEENRGNQ
jgi:hypothetical protein